MLFRQPMPQPTSGGDLGSSEGASQVDLPPTAVQIMGVETDRSDAADVSRPAPRLRSRTKTLIDRMETNVSDLRPGLTTTCIKQEEMVKALLEIATEKRTDQSGTENPSNS